MNRFANCLATAGLLVLVSCSGGSTYGSALPPSTLNLTGTLQGIVADAVTGKRIGGDLKLYLVQGATIRGPSRLITDAADPLQGEYAFTGVPVEANSNNATWKLVAIAGPYQRFESEFTFKATTSTAIIDGVYNKIGNVFMFPTGTVAPDYNFTVLFNGKPVPNATVELDPLPGANEAKFSVTGNLLAANTGYVSSVTALTNTAGVATIPGAQLVLGGAYQASVLPLVFTDPAGTDKVQTALTFGNEILVGFSNSTSGFPNNDVDQTIDVTDEVTGTPSTQFYIATESNTPPNEQLFANGQLVITFSSPVTLQNPTCFDAAMVPGTKADLSGAGSLVPSPTQPVNATLSADGLTLTLAPNYQTAPAATDRGVQVTYKSGPPAGSTACGTGAGGTPEGGLVIPKDYPAEPFAVFSPYSPTSPAGVVVVKTATGATNDGIVHVTGP